MKVSILVDNNTLIDRYFFGEPGLSILIETDDKTILFDVGYSDIFIHNACKLNFDLFNLDYLVLSHGHLDHTWGLTPLIRHFAEAEFENRKYKKPVLVTHPKTLLSKIYKDYFEIGSLNSEKKLTHHFVQQLSAEPVWLTDRLVFLGEIDRLNDFEGMHASGRIKNPETGEVDHIIEDSALCYKSSEGLVVITGCSHSGICNIVEHAKKVCEEERVADIIGGLHLLNPSDEQMKKTVDYIRNLKLNALHACHCTDLHSKIALSACADIVEVGSGMQLEYL